MKSKRKNGHKRVIVSVNLKWCKRCGICVEFCPENVFDIGELNRPEPVRPELCNVCRMCELRCPEFAVTVNQED